MGCVRGAFSQTELLFIGEQEKFALWASITYLLAVYHRQLLSLVLVVSKWCRLGVDINIEKALRLANIVITEPIHYRTA
jgi:hypothetical protein